MQIGSLKQSPPSLAPLVPSTVVKYLKEGFQVVVEAKTGLPAFFSDDDYLENGALIQPRREIIEKSDLLLVDSSFDPKEISLTKPSAIIIGRFNPLVEKEYLKALVDTGRLIFSLDMVPRSSIAQSMDILSSLASLSGYQAVISAAEKYPGYFPMMSTAAGTVPPVKMLVLGAGVAGLQAIATGRRLGAVIEAFDVRSAVKEEVQSLGAKFIEVEGGKEDTQAGGYAVQQSKEYLQKQKELIHERATKSDVIISTANIPGKKAPLLIEERTVEAMKKGSIIIDMASDSGGNCEVSENGKTIDFQGVTIIGDAKLYLKAPREASRLYSTNLHHFIRFVLKDGLDGIPFEHEILQKAAIGKLSEAKIAI